MFGQTPPPRNTVLEVSALLEAAKLQGPQDSKFLLLERSAMQSLHLLRLGPGARLTERYHERHDLTLVAVQGSAIVKVEGERYFVEAPATIFIPRLYGYEILPHKSEAGFSALAIYSPPFRGKDWCLVERKQ